MILQARFAFTMSILWISSIPAKIHITLAISVQQHQEFKTNREALGMFISVIKTLHSITNHKDRKYF